jgi:hypothetical protein
MALFRFSDLMLHGMEAVDGRMRAESSIGKSVVDEQFYYMCGQMPMFGLIALFRFFNKGTRGASHVRSCAVITGQLF